MSFKRSLLLLSLSAVAGFNALAQNHSPLLIGGAEVDPQHYQSVIAIRSANSACTATLVGPEVVLTAAHCISSATIRFKVNNTSYTASCNTAKEYGRGRGDVTADYALCRVSEPVVGVDLWETLNTDPAEVKLGAPLLLAGYGCTKVGGGGTHGVLKAGLAKVSRLPKGNNDIVTNDAQAVCFGDSGGPAWAVAILPDQAKRRYIVGVNSRGDIKTVTYLSGLHTRTARAFVQRWMNIYPDVEICGTHRAPTNCRMDAH